MPLLGTGCPSGLPRPSKVCEASLVLDDNRAGKEEMEAGASGTSRMSKCRRPRNPDSLSAVGPSASARNIRVYVHMAETTGNCKCVQMQTSSYLWASVRDRF